MLCNEAGIFHIFQSCEGSALRTDWPSPAHLRNALQSNSLLCIDMQTMLMQASGLTAQCSSRSQPVHNRWQRTCWRLRSSGFRSGTQLQQRVSNGAVCRAFFKLGGQTSESGGQPLLEAILAWFRDPDAPD